MNSKPALSVVIPAYNEQKNYESGLLQPALDFLNRQKYTWELILVNDGSTDGTLGLLNKLVKTNPRYCLLDIPHGGKAAAVTAGILSARGEIILFTDFDQSTPLSQISQFLSAHQQGADVAIGIRGEKEATKQDTVFRRIRSKAFLSFVQLVALPGIRDSQCGFKSFKNHVAKKIFSSLRVSRAGRISGGYMGAFDVEVLYLARKFGYSIFQLPVEWIKVPSEKLNVWKEPLMMARDTLKVRLYDILGWYASE